MTAIVQNGANGTMGNPPTESSSESLVMKAQAGDRAAFSALVERYFGTVWAIAYARLREWQAAEDLTQEVFVLALLHLDSLSDPKRFAGWLGRIAQHRAIDWIRSRKRSSELVAMVPTASMNDRAADVERYSAEHAMEKEERSRAVREAIFALPAEQGEIVMLHFSEGLNKKEIADRLDVHPGTVGRILDRALKAMRGSLRSFAKEPMRVIGVPPARARTATLAMVEIVAALPLVQRTKLIAACGGLPALGPGALSIGAAKAGLGLFGVGGWIMATAKIAGVLGLLAAVGLLAFKVTAGDGANKTNPPAAAAMASVTTAPSISLDADTLRQQGWVLFQKHQNADAADKFQQAIQLVPEFTDAWSGLGWSQFTMGQPDKAEAAFDKALALDANYASSLNGMGWVFFGRSQLDKAEGFWLKATGSTGAESGLCKIYLLEGRWDEAAKYAQGIIDSGDMTGADLAAAKVWLRAARDRNLSPDLRAEISPVAPQAAQSAASMDGWAAWNRGDMVGAKTLFEQALAANPNEDAALNGLGWVLMRVGRANDAREKFEADLKINPDNGGAMNGLAQIDRQQGRLDDAIAIWEKMAQKFP
ncbi:MAG TPA: sigma-70 family RNA polymerase sigma factor, partial [Tepidisphaeraceae bacterium]